MSDQTSRASVPRSRSYAAGDVIAEKYRLVRPLGEGGMGTVWLAHNLALDTEVALKLIRSEVKAIDAADRLLKEARAAAQLRHPAIVRIYDFGRTRFDDPFIVMEVLVGESLAEVLARRTRISPVRAVQTVLPVLDALSVAHSRSIVHRDLKPDNIFLAISDHRTQPKLVDFGIAKFSEEDPAQTLTLNGTILGSPEYMAPEQARGQADVDHRADVWAICLVLYEAITGRPAFQGENYNALMRAIIEDDVIPTTDLAAGDAALWNIVRRGLEKEREARWQDVSELGIALARWLFDAGVDTDLCGQKLADGWLDRSDPSERPDLFSSPPATSEAARASAHSLHEWTQATHPGDRGTVDSVPRGLSTSVRPVPRRRWPAVAMSAVALAGVAWIVWAGRAAPPPLAEEQSSAATKSKSKVVAQAKPALNSAPPEPARVASGTAPTPEEETLAKPAPPAPEPAHEATGMGRGKASPPRRAAAQPPRARQRKPSVSVAKTPTPAPEPAARKLDLKDPY